MIRHLTRSITTAVALTAAMFGVMATTASAEPLPPGTPAAGPAILTPASGNSGSRTGIMTPSPSFCQGDSASGGYRINTFLVSDSIDPATLSYTGDGPVLPAGAPAGAIAYSLYGFVGQTTLQDINTAINTGQVSNVPDIGFDVYTDADAPLPPGNYKIGIACTLAADTTRFWSTPITIAADTVNGGPLNFTYAPVTPPGDVPEAPLAILLPASALGLMGGAALMMRRRRRLLPVG